MSAKLHIALVHDALIPPLKYGGTERVIALLARGLAESGHTVTLVARPGSQIAGIETIPYSAEFEKKLPNSVQLVHLHAPLRRALRLPYLTTIHGNGKPGETFDATSVFISRKHAQLHGSTHFVHNGIDTEAFQASPTRTGRWVFLAKASWSVKNLEGALQVAREAGVELEVIGSRDWPFGLHRHVPRVDGVRYWGMLAESEKRTLLAHSEGLLFPVRWHEPFGLAVVEALASGCPVLATPYGSLPELITPDVGWLSTDAKSWVNILRQPLVWSRQKCIARARQLFDYRVMTQNYLRYYAQVIEKGTLLSPGERPPAAGQNFHAQNLLAWTSPWE